MIAKDLDVDRLKLVSRVLTCEDHLGLSDKQANDIGNSQGLSSHNNSVSFAQPSGS